MAAETFGDVWRRVRLHVPAAPTFLVREWVNAAWKPLGRMRHWSFLYGELRLTIAAARTLAAVTVTNGSPTVTSAGLFLPADAGRQFRVANYPTYTIQTVTNVNSVDLDIAYGESTASAAATIYDGYATMPADFESFRIIADPYNQRRLAFWISADQLNILDPTRQGSDTGPRLLAQRPPSTYTPTLGRVQYEYWPKPTADRSYPAFYNKMAARLDDTTTFSGVMAEAADVLVMGALAQAALWPGTPDLSNPYFRPGIYQEKQAEFLQGVQQLSLRDDDQHPDDLATVHWERWPLADLAYNDQALRATDATVADLY
jgi:hypothetical protein